MKMINYASNLERAINAIETEAEKYKQEHDKLHEEHNLAHKIASDYNKAERNQIKHIINTGCVCRDDTNYKQILSVIHFGDIVILSEKKFSKFTRWLYKKLFGWVIEDYEWGAPFQRRLFY